MCSVLGGDHGELSRSPVRPKREIGVILHKFVGCWILMLCAPKAKTTSLDCGGVF